MTRPTLIVFAALAVLLVNEAFAYLTPIWLSATVAVVAGAIFGWHLGALDASHRRAKGRGAGAGIWK